MKRLLLLLLLPLLCAWPSVNLGGVVPVVAGGTSYLCVYDDMSGTFGTNWTTAGTQALSFSGGKMTTASASGGNMLAEYKSTMGSTDQSGSFLFEVNSGPGNTRGVAFRKTDATWSTNDTLYSIHAYDNESYSRICTITYPNTETECDTISLNPTTNRYYHFRITGTGSGTTLKIWENASDLGVCNHADANCGWSTPTVDTTLGTLGHTNNTLSGVYGGVYGYKNDAAEAIWDNVRLGSLTCNN